MANVKTFNLSVYLPGTLGHQAAVGQTITFRGISRVAVKRYIEYYKNDAYYEGNHVEERK